MNATLTLLAQPYRYYHGKEWRPIMTDSRVSLVPRDFGRTAYHLMETLQSDLMPLFVYDDTPWISYVTLYHEKKLGYSSTVKGQQEARIASYRQSHFTPAGIMQQSSMFMMPPGGEGGGTDLECRALPGSTRNE
jgi:hypothetical protein